MCTAYELNEKFLLEMLVSPGSENVLSRIRDCWWEFFVREFNARGAETILDNLDISMGGGREQLQELSKKYALARGFERGSPEFIQRASQFLKSNTGKMFERFIGLSLAHALKHSNSSYCVLPFRQDNLPFCHNSNPDFYTVDVRLGESIFSTKIDSDLISFNPEDSESDIYLISIKSTLKDRFHNVPFWNLLRLASVGQLTPNLSAKNSAFLTRLKYVAICSDLALEQPDFSNPSGPRNLISLDAALLDGAYVSSSRALGLGTGENHLGPERDYPFYPLSLFYRMLKNA